MNGGGVSGVSLCDVEAELRALCGGHRERNFLTSERLRALDGGLTFS